MRIIHRIHLIQNTREEQLPDFSLDFPYIATCAHLHNYADPYLPWHWHKPVELFFMEQGSLEYETLGGKLLFPEGAGGFVNSNVLHRTRIIDTARPTVQKLHIFDPDLLSGQPGGKIQKTYFLPLLADPMLEIMHFSPEIPEQAEILRAIQAAFLLDDTQIGYEISLQRALLDIWLKIFRLYSANQVPQHKMPWRAETVKGIMVYIREHLAEPLTVRELANVFFLSERECYRLFRQCLHTTPVNYILDCRLQEACRQLADSSLSVTEIAYACGFGSGSYFSRVFTARKGCTPSEYRCIWQDKTKEMQ